MKNLINLILFVSPLLFFSQMPVDTFYVMYNPKIDRHFQVKGKIHYFDIYLRKNKRMDFEYGTAVPRRKVKKITFPLTSRQELLRIIKKDSPAQLKLFYIITKEKDSYVLYETDYMGRDTYDYIDYEFWGIKKK